MVYCSCIQIPPPRRLAMRIRSSVAGRHYIQAQGVRYIKILTTKPAPYRSPMKKIRQRNLQLILDAACEVFADCGFSAARLSDVAERSGVAKANDALLLPLEAQLTRRCWTASSGPCWKSPGYAGDQPPAEELRAYVDNKMRISAERPHAARVFSCEDHARRAAHAPAPLLERPRRPRNATPSASASGSTKACWRRWIRTTCCSTCGR